MMMSVKGEITTDVYRQMMDLQEKLRQSEAERIRLEEMFTVLVKTFREEEDMRLKNLENRYQMFLEDCAKRSYRNEKILRSVERVESGANALHAKTERLKLLRSHYEAYLERAIPTWRRPALLRYGPSALQSTQEMECSRRNQLNVEENVVPNYMNHILFGSSSRPSRTYGSNPIITSEYLSSSLVDGEKPIKSFPSERNQFDKNYWNSMTREPQEKEKFIYGYDKGFQEDIGIQDLEPRTNMRPKGFQGHFEDEFVDGRKSPMKGLESALHRKLGLGDRSHLRKNILYQEGGFKEGVETLPPKTWDAAEKIEQASRKQGKAGTSPVWGEEYWVSDRKHETLPSDVDVFEKSYIDRTPVMSREPVEIKKPEIIVGKLHPEGSFQVDYFKNSSNFEGPAINNVKPEPLPKSVNGCNLQKNGEKIELENVRTEVEVRQPQPQAKWSLLKHRRTIDKLKETLSFEEAQEPKLVQEKKQSENLDNLSTGKTFLDGLKKEDDETDTSQSLTEGWRSSDEQAVPPKVVVQASLTPDKEARSRNGSEQYQADEKNIKECGPTYQEDFQEIPQKDVNDPNEEVYEDNEESYPESYYEQPPKSDYSRDIVSNVILEEDESELNIHGELPESTVQTQESVQGEIAYEQPENNIQTGYNGYNVDGTVEMKETENEYQNYQSGGPSHGYHNGNLYQANYGEMQPQEGYTYDNQENNYNTNNGLEYNNMEPYPGNGEAQQYYESQQSEEHGNYPPEGMSQGENFANAYDQAQNYENIPAMEQYNEGNEAYQQEYNQGQDENYYSQGEYDGYYQSQQEQNGEYPINTGHENVGYSETTAYGNIQDGNSFADGSNNLPLRQNNLLHLLESDSESFQMEHGSAPGNEDSDFDISMSQQQ